MLGALLLAVIFGLPGISVLAAARARGAAPWPWPRGVAVTLALGVAVAAVTAIVLGAVSRYSLGAELAALGAFAAVGFATCRFRPAWPFARATPIEAAGFAFVTLLASAMFFGRPYEMLLGERDATVYTVSGIGLARQGSLILRDLAADGVGTEAMRRFYPGSEGREDRSIERRTAAPSGWLPWPQFVKYPGFYYVDAEREHILAQGLALLPAVIAIFYGAFGISGAFVANNFIGVVAVLAVFAAGVELVGEAAALVGATILACSVAEVWAARYPVAEILMQALLFSGFAAFLRGDRLGQALAGVLIGAMFFAKIEAALVLPPIAAYALVGIARRRHVVSRSFWSAFVAMLTAAVLYWVAFAPDYVRSAFRTFSSFQRRTAERYSEPGSWTVYLVAGIVLAVAALLLARARRREGLTLAAARAGAFAILLFATFGYWVRPYFPGMVVGQPMTFVWLAWYLTPVVVLVGFAGLAHHLATKPRAEHLFVLGVALTLAGVFLHFMYVNLIHPYLTRRFVPAAIPIACLFFGHAVVWIATRGEGRSRIAAAALAAALVAGSVASLVARGCPLYRSREYPGLERALASLAEELRGADLVFLGDRPVRNLLGATLEFVYGLPTVIVWPGAYTVHHDVIRKWLDEGRRIAVVTSRTELESVAGTEEFDRVAQSTIELRALRQVKNAFPAEIDQETIGLTRYAAGPGSHPLYDFWQKAGQQTADRICAADTRLLDGDPFLVRRIRARCPSVAAGGKNIGVVVGSSAAEEWADALTLYGARFVRHDLAGVDLLDGISPQPMAGGAPLSGEHWKLEASDGHGTEARAVDGRLDTRWASRGPQRPGMTYTVEFDVSTDVTWAKIRMGRLELDRARALAFETSADGEHWQRRDVPTVVTGIRWNGKIPEENADGNVDLWVNARGIRFFRLVNLGESSRFDWAIVELEIYGRRAP